MPDFPDILFEVPVGTSPFPTPVSVFNKNTSLGSVVIDHNLPKMEFNAAAKQAKNWYRPTTPGQVDDALAVGYVIKEDMYDDMSEDETPLITWNPIKHSKVSTLKPARLANLRICPEEQYIVMRLAMYKQIDNTVIHMVMRTSTKGLDIFQAMKGDAFVKWMEPARFIIVPKDVGYV